jgi:hypothetical protein
MPAALTLPPRNCDICGAEYQPKHKRARYCSKPCFWKSKNQRVVPEARERYAATRRTKWAENRDAYNLRAKVRYRSDRERVRKWHETAFQKARVKTPWLSLIYTARDRAKKKNLPFTLTPEWAIATWTGRCAITDIPFLIGQRGSGPKRLSPSIDRIEPALGYVPDNCRFILHAINAFKQDGTDAEMLEIARAIVRKSCSG